MTEDIFENNHREIVAERVAAETLIVDVDGYEGPLDLLLTLSRTQKVDLRKISILDLAKQYLEFVERAKALRIELAADYLVMAAWLAFLKSRLLLPPESRVSWHAATAAQFDNCTDRQWHVAPVHRPWVDVRYM